MKRILLIWSLMLPLVLQAQNKQVIVSSFQAAELGDLRARTSNVRDQNGNVIAYIEVSMPVMDSAVQFSGAGIVDTPRQYPGFWAVFVAEGTKQIRITVPGCAPVDYSFPLALESARAYEMKLKIVDKEENRTLVLPYFSYTTSQPSYGIMLSFLWKGYGPYVKAKTNFTFGLDTPSECDADGMVNGVKGWFTGKTKTSRQSITAGFVGLIPFRNNRNFALYAYLGGGYGKRTLAWESYGVDGEYEYTKVVPYSYQGVEVEMGLVLRLGSFALMGGAQTNQFKHIEANVGVGFMF